MEDWLIDAIRQAAAPIAVEICSEESASSEANQLGLDRAVAEDLEWARWAVGRWAAFPVGRVPRPLVLIGSVERVDGGFRSGDAKLAFMRGLIEAAVPVPEAVLAALRHRPDGASQPRPGTKPLMITSAVCSETEFRTDRGRRVLQAWRLEADDAKSSIWVPDPAVVSLAWAPAQPPATPPPFQGSPHRSISAALAPDGQTLALSFVGAVPEIVEYPSAEAVESDQAVAIVPVARYIGPPASFHREVGRQREVLVPLKQPLGARVLVDLDSSPAEVSESHQQTGVRAESIHHRTV